MKYLIIIAIVFIFLVACNLRRDKIQTIPKDAFLVDVRTPSEFSAGHVPNSVNIPLDQVDSSLKEFSEKRQIIVFCRSGMRSGKAKKILKTNGFKNVINGGSWKSILSKQN